MSMIKDLSHLCLSGIFITAGAQAFLSPGARVNKVADAGIPQPNIAVELNGAAMVICGVLLALGIAPRLAAAILIICTVPTTIVGHAFWKEESETARKNQQIQFAKNLGLIGGLLMVLIKG